MREIHCHGCGGLITDPARVSYRLASDAAATVAPHTGLCTCQPPIVYGPPPGYLSLPGLASVSRSKAAARN
jgi:creatinine amidohydrolase/Fe(II)-dependent formamide hydrolase-like protein